MTPEAIARQKIDTMLVAGGWVVQDYAQMDLSAGVAQLQFLYESTGEETFFCSEREPETRSRQVFGFHRPETLAGPCCGTMQNRVCPW